MRAERANKGGETETVTGNVRARRGRFSTDREGGREKNRCAREVWKRGRPRPRRLLGRSLDKARPSLDDQEIIHTQRALMM